MSPGWLGLTHAGEDRQPPESRGTDPTSLPSTGCFGQCLPLAGRNRKLGSAEIMVSLLGPEWAEKGRERV